MSYTAKTTKFKHSNTSKQQELPKTPMFVPRGNTYLVLFTPARHFHTCQYTCIISHPMTKPGKTTQTTKVKKGEVEANKNESYAVMCDGKSAS